MARIRFLEGVSCNVNKRNLKSQASTGTKYHLTGLQLFQYDVNEINLLQRIIRWGNKTIVLQLEYNRTVLLCNYKFSYLKVTSLISKVKMFPSKGFVQVTLKNAMT